MRIAALSLLALPLLGVAAEESPFDEYKAQFQTYLDKFGSYIPNPNRQNVADNLEAKIGEKKMSVLTIDNWRETLYEPVAADATQPEEWWLLISGRNKTCFGRCDKVDLAFNQTAAKFALDPTAPHMAYINCDEQPVLCNIFSAGPSTLWSIGLLPPGNQVDIWARRLNVTTVTSDDLVEIHKADDKEGWKLIESILHPFNSFIAENGLSVPVAYFLWFFSVLPSWATMLIISFASRNMMNRRAGAPNAGAGDAAGR